MKELKVTEVYVNDLSESAAERWAKTLNKYKNWYDEEQIKTDVYTKLKALLGIKRMM